MIGCIQVREGDPAWMATSQSPGNAPASIKRLARRLLVHLVRFAVLAVGAVVAVELFFAMWLCLKDFERVKMLSDVADCANMIGFFLTWLPHVAIHLTLAGILAFVGTVLWAWRDRRRS